VSCIYGIGSVETYSAMTLNLKVGDPVDRAQLVRDILRSLGQPLAQTVPAALAPR